MSEILRPDLCVIGGGSAGLTVAAAARAFGASVVLVEKGAMGGDCLNAGCVPSKALIAAARHAASGREAGAFGVGFPAAKVDYAALRDHIAAIIADIAPNDSAERFEALGVTLIRAAGRFVDRKTLEAGTRRIRARRFVIAAGSRPLVPAIPGLETVPYLTNETTFALAERPNHLVVVGGGPVGLELAQAHRRLGAAVTVIEMAEFLAGEDPELVEIGLRRLRAEGVDLRARTRVVSVAATKKGIALTLSGPEGEEAIAASHLLIAAGRTPNVENLGLEAARIRCERTGIRVDAGMRSTNRRAYAIGDVAGPLRFTHVASYHAALVIRSALFGLPARAERRLLPRAVFTDPEIAAIGMSEAEALTRYPRQARILRWSYADNDRSRAERRTDGLVKLITHRNGRILGAAIVGPGAGETIALFSLALANRLKVGSLVKFVAPYPTLAEMARRVALEHYRDRLASPWIGRWLGLIRHLP